MIRIAPRVNRSIENVGCATLVPAQSLDDDAMQQMTAGVHNAPSRKCYFRECYLMPVALSL